MASVSQVIDGFLAIIACELPASPKNIKADGKLHRFSIEKKGDLSGWYVLHLDNIPAGSFGNWKTGESHKWVYGKGYQELTAEERESFKREMELRKAKESRQREFLKKRAQTVARELWKIAQSYTDRAHPYLVKKRVAAYGVRTLPEYIAYNILNSHKMRCSMLRHGVEDHVILVPMFDTSPSLQSLQLINKDGAKLFLSGTQKKGLFHLFGTGKIQYANEVDLVEGYATAASLYESRHNITVSAFDCGNLLPVAEALFQAYPRLKINLIADDDRKHDDPEKNAGIKAAKLVRRMFPKRVTVFIPDFPDDAPQALSDFNDLVTWRGDQRSVDLTAL